MIQFPQFKATLRTLKLHVPLSLRKLGTEGCHISCSDLTAKHPVWNRGTGVTSVDGVITGRNAPCHRVGSTRLSPSSPSSSVFRLKSCCCLLMHKTKKKSAIITYYSAVLPRVRRSVGESFIKSRCVSVCVGV